MLLFLLAIITFYTSVLWCMVLSSCNVSHRRVFDSLDFLSFFFKQYLRGWYVWDTGTSACWTALSCPLVFFYKRLQLTFTVHYHLLTHTHAQEFMLTHTHICLLYSVLSHTCTSNNCGTKWSTRVLSRCFKRCVCVCVRERDRQRVTLCPRSVVFSDVCY